MSNITAEMRKTLLHVGCGPAGDSRLHPYFRSRGDWKEIRLDIDPAVAPDIVCSITDMRAHVRDGAVDGLWSSHNIEHLFDHDVLPAFREMARVLSQQGFALLRCPDLLAVVAEIHTKGLEAVSYISAAGPITPLDMLFGHRASIEKGAHFMAHRTGFSAERLGHLLIEAGFSEVRTLRDHFDLWAIAFRNQAPSKSILAEFAALGLDFGTIAGR